MPSYSKHYKITFVIVASICVGMGWLIVHYTDFSKICGYCFVFTGLCSFIAFLFFHTKDQSFVLKEKKDAGTENSEFSTD